MGEAPAAIVMGRRALQKLLEAESVARIDGIPHPRSMPIYVSDALDPDAWLPLYKPEADDG